MDRVLRLMSLVLVASCVNAPINSTWVDLSDLSVWDQRGDANWSTEQDTIKADSGEGYLVSPINYDDFELLLEFYAADDTNSGVYFRCEDVEVINGDTCYEANIFDHRPSGKGRTGAIVRVAEPPFAIEAEGHWNSYRIRAHGPELVVILNGIETVNARHHRNTDGYLALQFITGGIVFRNIRIREL